MKNLVVVESPTKSKTIERYLGADFTVLATVGHFRDVEDNGVDTDNEFALTFKIHDEKRKILREIIAALKGCETLVLATDPDREGEAIAWHLHEYLHEKKALSGKTVQRVIFHEITQTAVEKAFERPREIDNKLVHSALARRALDMLFGFGISRVLWHALPGTKSGGRLQSPSLRLTCEREEEIENFVPREHWTVDAILKTQAGKDIKFQLTHLDGQKLKKFSLKNETAAQRAVSRVSTETFSVTSVKRRQIQKRPSAPFRTSTLQQVASRSLNMSPEHSASVAQELFREGLITYMRTDSVILSSDAVNAIRSAIENSKTFGSKYLPAKPKIYTNNKTKNAQEAHEGIRPTDITRSLKDLPVHLKRDAVRLYDLIWKRTMASQMENGLDDQLGIDVSSSDQKLILHAAGSTVAFDGFRKLYYEENDEEQSDSKQGTRLPDVRPNDPLELAAVSPEQHYTKPPARYNEASLIAKLEELGIGRPSTYPGIIKKLKERTYISVENKQLIPQDMGRGKIILLECLFSRLVDYAFTAGLEDKLDEIANGKLDYKEVMEEFYQPFAKSCSDVLDLKGEDILTAMNKFAGVRFFPVSENGEILKCPKCDIGDYSFKNGVQSGVFLGCTEFKNGCTHTLPLAKKKRLGTSETLVLGESDNGEIISVRKGPFGFYVQQGEKVEGKKPKRASLSKGIDPEDCDLEMAKKLLSIPRVICEHPETREPIWAKERQHGPYIEHDGDTRSLSSEDDIYTIGCNRAVSLLAEPKTVKSFRRSSEKIRSLGPHSKDGNEVAIFKGRYPGYYIKHSKTNAGLPKQFDVETITLEEAEHVLAEKASKPKRRPKKKGSTTKRNHNPPARKN